MDLSERVGTPSHLSSSWGISYIGSNVQTVESVSNVILARGYQRKHVDLFIDKRDKVTVCLDLSELNTELLW